MAENKFMNLLSDIDEKYIKDLTEEKTDGKEEDDPYQEAEIVIVEKKKSSISLARIFSYAAAALLITAAIGFGARLVKDKLPVDPTNTQETENAEPSGTGTATLPEDPNEQLVHTVDIKDISRINSDYLMEETDISQYPRISIDSLPNVDDCYERIFGNYGDGSEKIITKSILDTKECGEFKLSLIGYGLFTDNKMYKDKLIALWGYRIVLEQDGNIISSEALDVDLFADNNENTERDETFPYPLCMLNKNSMAEITSVDDFGDNQIVTVRAVGDDAFARSRFYGVKNHALYICVRPDLNFAWEFEYLSGICSASTGKYQNEYIIADEFAKKKYEFDFRPEDEIVSYYVSEIEVETDISKYDFWGNLTINKISDMKFDNSFDKVNQIMALCPPNVMIDAKEMDNVVLYLVGHYPRFEETDEDGFTCNGLKILVYQEGVYKGSIPVSKEVDSMVHFDNHRDMMPNSFVMREDTVLIANGLSGSYYGVDCFYAIKDGKFYSNIDGEWSNAAGDPPGWTKNVTEDKSVYGEYDSNSIVCGFYRYEFNFENLEVGGLVYHVYWLEEENYYG